MRKYYEALVGRLDVKKEELAKYRDQFAIMVENELKSACFEQNAINSLIVMTQVKKEIEALELEETIIRCQLNCQRR